MAISYRGTIQTYIGLGNDSLVHNLFTIENGLDSLVNVYVRRLAVQMDATVALATVMPIVSLYRASAVSGGIQIPVRTPFNSSQTSDSNVVFRSTVFDRYPITATPATAATWRQFCSKLRSAAKQQLAVDFNMLPRIVEQSGAEWVLKPGEYAVVRVDSPDVLTNPQNANNWMVECVWEEEPTISVAYSISGTVTLDGDPVEGVKVVVIEADTTALANPLLKTVETTGPAGTWSALIRAGKVGIAFYQYIDGAVYFTSDNAVAVTSLESTGDTILNAIAASDVKITDIQSRIPAALTAGGNMKVDLLAIDGVTDTADRLQRSASTIGYGTVGSGSTTTSIVTSALDPPAAAINQFKDRIVLFAQDTTTINLRGQAKAITASTADGILTVGALTDAPVSGDEFVIC